MSTTEGPAWGRPLFPEKKDRTLSDPNTPSTAPYPAGWYPDGITPGQERWYDGSTWTEQLRPTPVAAAEKKKPSKKVLIWGGIGAVVLLFVIIGAVNGGGKDDEPTTEPATVSEQTEEEPAAGVDVIVPDTTGVTAKEARVLLENAGLEVEFSADEGVVLDQDNWTVLGSTPAAGGTAKSGDTVVVKVEKTVTEQEPAVTEPEPEPEPELTLAQENAVADGLSYLDVMDFSRVGLIDQLEYEGYSTADATFAVDYIGPSWKKEAAGKAQSYLDSMSFSREGLYDQLEYEGFRPEQIEYALQKVGY